MDKLTAVLHQAWEAFDAGRLDEADRLYGDLIRETSPETKVHEEALHGLGFVRSYQGRFTEARQSYETLLTCARSRRDFWQESICLHQLGMVERMAERLEQAMVKFTAELAILVRCFPDQAGHLAANYYEQGYVTLLQGQVGEAEPLMSRSLEYAERSGDPVVRGCSLRGMGQIAAAGGKAKAALQFYAASCRAFAEANDLQAIAEVERLMATVPAVD